MDFLKIIFDSKIWIKIKLAGQCPTAWAQWFCAGEPPLWSWKLPLILPGWDQPLLWQTLIASHSFSPDTDALIVELKNYYYSS